MSSDSLVHQYIDHNVSNKNTKTWFFLFAVVDPTTNSVVLKGHCIPTTAYIGVKGKSREKKKIETFKRHRVPGQTIRSVNGCKPIKNGNFTDARHFSYTDIS